MLLKIDGAHRQMKVVYSHSKELQKDPARVAAAQALTLNSGKPLLGLKGKYGLYGSQEWWDNIYLGNVPLLFFSGIIVHAYAAGQDNTAENNTVELLVEDGSVIDIGIYVNESSDVELFRAGCELQIVYALDEMKKQPGPDGDISYAKVALEVAVSLGFPERSTDLFSI